jgi:hypothetical protein
MKMTNLICPSTLHTAMTISIHQKTASPKRPSATSQVSFTKAVISSTNTSTDQTGELQQAIKQI